MKTTKRIAALLMAVVMVFALSAVALAEDGKFSADVNGVFEFEKTIYMKNNTKGNYYRPQVTYTYEIVPASGSDLTYGAHAAGVTVHAGLAGGLVGITADGETSSESTSGTNPAIVKVTFKPKIENNVDAEKGVASTENISLKVDLSVYASTTVPGVYRYKITDTTSASDLKNVGIIRSEDYDADRFVDVYLQMENGALTIASIVVADEAKIPTTDEDGKYIDKDNSETKYDPDDGYKVDDEGNLYKVDDDAGDSPVWPDDYHDTGKDVVTTDTLKKDGDVFNETPKQVKDPETGKPVTEPAVDDEGNPIDDDGNSYPSPEYIVNDTTGEILKLKDGEEPDPSDPSKYESISPEPKFQATYDTFEYPGDVYTSFNVVVKKVVSGPMGDPNHPFPFAVTVNNNSGYNSATTLGYVFEDAAGNATVKSDTLFDATLKHNQSFIIRGLNPYATVNYEETNDTDLKYNVTISNKSGHKYQQAVERNLGESLKVSEANLSIAEYDDTNKEFKTTADAEITFTNAQSAFSPTGVVLRFAPYILMLGAAMFFVVLARKQREQENA